MQKGKVAILLKADTTSGRGPLTQVHRGQSNVNCVHTYLCKCMQLSIMDTTAPVPAQVEDMSQIEVYNYASCHPQVATLTRCVESLHNT